jgi:hypothetical protein
MYLTLDLPCILILQHIWELGSSVDIATDYGLDDRGVGVRVQVEKTIFTSPFRPYHPASYWTVYGDSFSGGELARKRSWPPISNYCRGQENVGLLIHNHSPICHHGVGMDSWAQGTGCYSFDISARERLLIGKRSYSVRPPLWSSGQSSWLQIRRPGFDSRHYQKKK